MKKFWFGIAVTSLLLVAPLSSRPAFSQQVTGDVNVNPEVGKDIFRHDTFGSEHFWGGKLRLHDAIQGARFGGVGPGITPNQALALGLKVDVAVLPSILVEAIKAGSVSLDAVDTTLALLRANAVVGVRGSFDQTGRLNGVGITCAICHSQVDDALIKGIGLRLDGWPNRDLDIGRIIALAPNLGPYARAIGKSQAEARRILLNWGPGKFDAELNVDGKGFRPDGRTAATLNPPAFGLAGVNNHTWTGGWGTVTYWNAYVANLQMQGKGRFYDPRLDNPRKYPLAARNRLGHKQDEIDLITAKLPALHVYQLTLKAPRPPAGAYNAAAAAAGEVLFNSTARCAACHMAPIFTEPGWNTHKGAEIGIDEFQAKRSPDESYRTTPLRALWDTEKIHKGGFYHDGRFATLAEVVQHYDRHFGLGLSGEEMRNLIEYLKSI
jgi:hypothetical protein